MHGRRGSCFFVMLVFVAAAHGCGPSASRAPGGMDGRDAGPGGTDATGAGGNTDVPAADGPDTSTADADGADGQAAEALTVEVNTDGARDTGGETASVPPAPGSPLRAIAIATAVVHVCVLLDNQRIKCWGNNAFGAIGTGDARDRGTRADMGNALPFVDLGTGRTATAIAAGRSTTCAILDDGSVKCWGYRPMAGFSTPVEDAAIGDEREELGDALSALNLGIGRKATHIACGYLYCCAALDDGSASCWGANGTPNGEMAPTPTSLGSTAKVRQLVAARHGVMALFEDGRTSLEVPNTRVPLAFTTQDRATLLAGCADSSGCRGGVCGLFAEGVAKCTSSRPSLIPPIADLVALDVGLNHGCGLDAAGNVRCWGYTHCDDYPPGTSYWCPAGDPQKSGVVDVALGQPAVVLGTGGSLYSCAILFDGGVKCWATYQQCPNAAGGADPCGVPLSTAGILAESVAVVGTGANRRFGAWRTIDLGTHP